MPYLRLTGKPTVITIIYKRVESHVKECALHEQDISRAHVLNNFVILNFPFIREIQTYSPHFIHHHNINVMSARCVWQFGKSFDCLRMHARTDQIILANELAVASEFVLVYSFDASILFAFSGEARKIRNAIVFSWLWKRRRKCWYALITYNSHHTIVEKN